VGVPASEATDIWMLGVTALRGLGIAHVLPMNMHREMDRVLEAKREAPMERAAATRAVLNSVQWSLRSVEVWDETRTILTAILEPKPERRPSAHTVVREAGRLTRERIAVSQPVTEFCKLWGAAVAKEAERKTTEVAMDDRAIGAKEEEAEGATEEKHEAGASAEDEAAEGVAEGEKEGPEEVQGAMEEEEDND